MRSAKARAKQACLTPRGELPPGPQSEQGLRVEAALVELERIVARLTARVAHAA